MTILEDPEVATKSKLNIDLRGGEILLTDDGGKGGGNVQTYVGRKLVFKNRTAFDCTLTFQMLLAEDIIGDDPLIWPFSDPQPADTSLTLRVPAGGKTKCTLTNFGTALSIKYGVALASGAGAKPLDPIIIVRPLAS